MHFIILLGTEAQRPTGVNLSSLEIIYKAIFLINPYVHFRTIPVHFRTILNIAAFLKSL